MAKLQLNCKRCGGFIYEEEIYYDQDNVKNMQLGCYGCSHKSYIEYTKWKQFKNKLARACSNNVN